MTDKGKNGDSFWNDPDIQGWLRAVESDLLPKMESSAFALAISDGRVSADMAVQIGAAVLLDKPLVLLALPGASIPAPLQRVAAAIVRGSMTDPATAAATKARLSDAITAVMNGLLGMVLDQDPEVAPWVYGILHGEPTPAGDFLKDLAAAANRADPQNYPTLRPALLQMMARYPKYYCRHEPAWKASAPGPLPGFDEDMLRWLDDVRDRLLHRRAGLRIVLERLANRLTPDDCSDVFHLTVGFIKTEDKNANATTGA